MLYGATKNEFSFSQVCSLVSMIPRQVHVKTKQTVKDCLKAT